jgi:hypothetical protein
MKPLRGVLLICLATLLLACATPKPALEQANHTTALMAALEHELQAFRRAAAVTQDAQQESIRERKKAIMNERLVSGPWIRARKSAGDTGTQELMDKLLADADAMAADEALATDDDVSLTIAVPLESTTAAMTQAQAKMAAMGTDVPIAARSAELYSFAQAVKTSVDENRKKVEDATAKK